MILFELFEISSPNLMDMLFKIPCGNKGYVLSGNPYSLGLGHFKYKYVQITL